MNDIKLLEYKIAGMEKSLLIVIKDLNERIKRLEDANNNKQ